MVKQIQLAYPHNVYEELCDQVANFNTLAVCSAIILGPFISDWIIQEKAFSQSLILHALLCFTYALVYIIFVGGFS